TDGAPGEYRPSVSQLPSACARLRQRLVAEAQQIPCDAGRGIRQKGEQVDFGVPEIVPLIRLPGETFCRHARFIGPRRGLQDVKEVETDRLLDLNRRALRALLPDILDPDVASLPEILHVLLLRGEQL